MIPGIVASAHRLQSGGGITPPNIGEYWTGQGGYYAGIVTTTDEYGGIIAEFYSIVSDKEADVEAIWSNDTSITHYLEGGDDGDGLINTQAILNSGVVEQCPAFSHCVNYTRDGHSDFYLGSSMEYKAIRDNLLGQTDLPNPFIDGVQSFEGTWYWGSNDQWPFRVAEARMVYFGTGAFGSDTKNKVRYASHYDPSRVRPIRRIPISGEE